MTDFLWWHWAILGFGFVLSELLLPAFVLVWVGLGAFIVMLALLLVPGLDLAWQILLWTVSSLAMMGLWFKFFERRRHKTLAGLSSAQIIGEVGLLTEAVAPFQKGRVRFQRPIVGSDLWDCVADEAIEVGARVKVLRVDGSMVTVGRINP